MIPQKQFDHEKILAYIQKLQHEVEHISQLPKNMERVLSANEGIKNHKNQLQAKTKDQLLKQLIKSFEYLSDEYHYYKQISQVSKTLGQWQQRKKKALTKLADESRELSKKKMNKNLSQKEINSFQEQLKKFSIDLRKEMVESYQYFTNWRLKQNCEQLQQLTSTMERIKQSKIKP